MLGKSKVKMTGELNVELIKGSQNPPLLWKVKNNLTSAFIRGALGAAVAPWFTKLTGVRTFHGILNVTHVAGKTGMRTNYGVVSRHVVTDAFVEFLVDELQADTGELGDLKWHDSGVGVTPADQTDVDIETTDGESRVAGTQIEGASANIYKSVGTIPYTTTKAITEHGLFSSEASTTMVDHHVFSVINVVNGDSIVFTYEITFPANG